MNASRFQHTSAQTNRAHRRSNSRFLETLRICVPVTLRLHLGWRRSLPGRVSLAPVLHEHFDGIEDEVAWLVACHKTGCPVDNEDALVGDGLGGPAIHDDSTTEAATTRERWNHWAIRNHCHPRTIRCVRYAEDELQRPVVTGSFLAQLRQFLLQLFYYPRVDLLCRVCVNLRAPRQRWNRPCVHPNAGQRFQAPHNLARLGRRLGRVGGSGFGRLEGRLENRSPPGQDDEDTQCSPDMLRACGHDRSPIVGLSVSEH